MHTVSPEDRARLIMGTQREWRHQAAMEHMASSVARRPAPDAEVQVPRGEHLRVLAHHLAHLAHGFHWRAGGLAR